jgi:hypothetical protein
MGRQSFPHACRPGHADSSTVVLISKKNEPNPGWACIREKLFFRGDTRYLLVRPGTGKIMQKKKRREKNSVELEENK